MEKGMRQGLVLAAAAYLAWSLLSPGNAILLRHMGPLWMQAVRLGLAAVVVAIWLRPRRIRAALRLLADPRLLLALGLGTVVSFMLFALAQTRIGPAETTLGFFAAPLWTALLGWWLLQERVGLRFLTAVVALVAGAVMALDVGTQTHDPLGVALAVGSGLAWAGYSILVRKHGQGIPWTHLVGAGVFLAAPVFLVLAAAVEAPPRWAALPPTVWAWTAIQVAFPTILAIGCFQVALQRVPGAVVNLFVGLELVGAMLWSALLLGERYTWLQVAGTAVVVAAVTAYLRWGGFRDRRSLPSS